MSTAIPEGHEAPLLGAAIYHPEVFAKVGKLGCKFRNQELGKAFDHLAQCYADGIPTADISVVVSELTRAGLYEGIGGAAGLGRICTDAPGLEGAEYHAHEISERFDTSTGDGPPEAYPLTTKATDYLFALVQKVQRGEGDVLFNGGEVFDGFECGPGLLTVLGAPPGAGKTSMAMQYGFQALQHHPEIRLTVANAETGFDRLLKRELTRVTGVPAKALRFANLTESQLDDIEHAAAGMEPLLSRVDVFEPPYSLKRIEQLQAVEPGLLILDYLQKFSPPDMSPREGATAVSTELRNLCRMGWAVLALSATARTTGSKGSGHDSSKLTMASLKESGEIEFNADAVYLIRDQGETDQEHVHDVELDCAKNRNGSMGGRRLVFDKPQLEFRLPDVTTTAAPVAGGDFDDWSGADNPFAEECV